MSPAEQPAPRFDAASAAAVPLATARGCLGRARGAFLLLGSLGVAGLGWLVLNLVGANMKRDPDSAARIDAFARWVIEHRWLTPLAAAPAACIGLWMMLQRRRETAATAGIGRATPWVALSLASLWLLAVFAVILVTFILSLAPLYQYHDIG